MNHPFPFLTTCKGESKCGEKKKHLHKFEEIQVQSMQGGNDDNIKKVVSVRPSPKLTSCHLWVFLLVKTGFSWGYALKMPRKRQPVRAHWLGYSCKNVVGSIWGCSCGRIPGRAVCLNRDLIQLEMLTVCFAATRTCKCLMLIFSSWH